MVPEYVFKNHVSVPMFGLGLDQVRDQKQAYESVLCAFQNGYRSIDTASSYANEEAVGRAVGDSGLKRSEVYITTKLAAPDQGYDAALKAFDRSIDRLKMDYIDCFLIHWPGKYLFVDTWKAFLRLYEEKAVRVIGVCNFNPHHLEKLYEETGVYPMVDQFESHPYFPQNELAAYCRERSILTEAWSPLMCGGLILQDSVIKKIAEKRGKTEAQIVLRWHYQKGHRVFPKSVTPARIRSNIQIFDFELSEDEMQAVDVLADKNMRIGPNPDVFFELFY